MTKKKKAFLFLTQTAIIVAITLLSCIGSLAQSTQPEPLPKLFIGGGSLPDYMYDEFYKYAGAEAHLVVIPTATGREIDEAKIKADWHSSGFKKVSVLHTRDRDLASTPEFSKILKEASAVWLSGGSQSRLAKAYLGTQVEQELYNLIARGGVIGGSSAGAAIMSRVMISGGNPVPEITTGFNLFPGVILDQHFLKRNRIPRLSAAIRERPNLIGLGIDEDTAIIVEDKAFKVIGDSYVLRLIMHEGQLQVEAFEAGEIIPIP
jgi:cyanophycinase